MENITLLPATQQEYLITPEDAERLRAFNAVADALLTERCFAIYRQRISRNTDKRQRNDLQLFAEIINAVSGANLTWEGLYNNPSNWQHIDRAAVEVFRHRMLVLGYDLHTINVRLSTIRVYARLVHECGLMSAEQYGRIQGAHGYSYKEIVNVDEKRDRTRIGIKKENFNVVPRSKIAGMKHMETLKPSDVRDRLLLVLFLDHGLRVSEVAGLRVGDVDLDVGIVSFHRPKVKKDDRHRLTEDSAPVMAEYMALIDTTDPAAPLIRQSRKPGVLLNEGMTTRSINRRIGEIGKRFGIPNLSPHDFRHTAATAVIKDNPINSVLQFFGWDSSAMAVRYAKRATIGNENIKLNY